MLLLDAGTTYNWSIGELRAFCLVCDSGNLSQVALRLGMSQSAVSLMVKRWRRVIGDPLFVRGRYGMVPTETAIALHQKLQPLLEELRLTLARPLVFDATSSPRVFKIHMSEVSQLVFLPELNACLNRTAPLVRLLVRNLRWEDVENGLASGDIDMAIGSLPMIRGRVRTRILRRQRFVTVMRKEHHLARTGLDPSTFATAEHLVIDAPSSGHALVESVLRSKGLLRRVGLTVPHFLGVENVLATSDYLLTVPEVGVSALLRREAFHVVATPFQLPGFDIRVHWHERGHEDEGIRWLRDVIGNLFAPAVQTQPV